MHKPPSWEKFTDSQKEDFVKEVSLRLQDIDLPYECMSCRDIHCKSLGHRRRTDALMADVLGVLEDAANKAIPDSKKKSSKPKVTNWKAEVEPLQEKARFEVSKTITCDKSKLKNAYMHALDTPK